MSHFENDKAITGNRWEGPTAFTDFDDSNFKYNLKFEVANRSRVVMKTCINIIK